MTSEVTVERQGQLRCSHQGLQYCGVLAYAVPVLVWPERRQSNGAGPGHYTGSWLLMKVLGAKEQSLTPSRVITSSVTSGRVLGLSVLISFSNNGSEKGTRLGEARGMFSLAVGAV